MTSVHAEIMKALRAPFSPDVVSFRLGTLKKDKTAGMALAYVDARDVMNRLDDVFGLNWQADYIPMPNGTCCCRIGVKVAGEWIWRANGGANITDSDKDEVKEMAEKGTYSDAFKRAAVLFGIGHYLYNLNTPWVEIEARGNSFVMKKGEEAKLRKWLAGQAPRSERPAAPVPAQSPLEADQGHIEQVTTPTKEADPRPTPAQNSISERARGARQSREEPRPATAGSREEFKHGARAPDRKKQEAENVRQTQAAGNATRKASEQKLFDDLVNEVGKVKSSLMRGNSNMWERNRQASVAWQNKVEASWGLLTAHQRSEMNKHSAELKKLLAETKPAKTDGSASLQADVVPPDVPLTEDELDADGLEAVA